MQNLLFSSQNSNPISGAADVMNYSVPNQIIVSGNLIMGCKNSAEILERFCRPSLLCMILWRDKCEHLQNLSRSNHWFLPTFQRELHTNNLRAQVNTALRCSPCFLKEHFFPREISQRSCHKLCLEVIIAKHFGCISSIHWFQCARGQMKSLMCKRFFLCSFLILSRSRRI